MRLFVKNPVLLFSAGRQAIKFRYLLYFSFVCLLGSAVGSYSIAFIGDDDAAPNDERWLLAIIVLLCGILFFGGMTLYATRYVVALWWDVQPQTVTIETMRLHGTTRRQHRVADFSGVDFSAGKYRTYYHRIETPYLKLRVRGRHLPYVVDLQGSFPDRLRFDHLFRDSAANASR